MVAGLYEEMERRLPVDRELLEALKELLLAAGATSVTSVHEVPGTDLEIVITLRCKPEG